MSRRIISMAVGAVALLAAFGCGSGSSDTSVRSNANGAGARVAAADGAVGANGLRTVKFDGVEFDVPADWPVYDLAADPSTCVRFDVHAVYLGNPSPDMQCPAGLVGRADAVLVQPEDESNGSFHAAAANAPGGVSTEDVHGLTAEVASGADVTSELDAHFPAAGLSTTIAYEHSDETAQRILASFRGAAK